MTTALAHDIEEIGRHFLLHGDYVSARPYGSGHINDTYAAIYNQGGEEVRYIIQRLNHFVFKNPAGLMENVSRVLKHCHKALESQGVEDTTRRALTLIPARDDKPYYVDPEGNHWRCYIFIENAETYDVVEGSSMAFKGAAAFGDFQKMLMDFTGPRLVETIPMFHHTRNRFNTLMQAVEEDVKGRAAEVQAEIDFFKAREADTDRLLDLQAAGKIPERITHNDTKFNNVMIDNDSHEGICIIDLDTVMPGLALYDFGDMVRTSTPTHLEDEPDLSKVGFNMDRFEAVASGYLSTAAEFLTPTEKANLAFAGQLITFENGIRFLTDYLQGDVYFKIKHPTHNLDRCRTQCRMVEILEEKMPAMQRFVEGL